MLVIVVCFFGAFRSEAKGTQGATLKSEHAPFEVGIDSGPGISPRNLVGLSLGYFPSASFVLELGIGLAGARTASLGNPVSLGMRLKTHSGVEWSFGSTTFQGQGLKQIAYSGT